MTNSTAPDSRLGVIYASASYVLWGIIPIYWRLLTHFGTTQLMLHRVFWCAIAVTIFVALKGNLPHIVAAFRNRRLIGTLVLTSLLISVNWGIYIWCVESNQLVEASLGYYINPLVSVALGVVLLGEKMTPASLAAVCLAGIAVTLQTLALGHFPWIALSLAMSFGFYGYFRKTAPIEAVEGLLVETTILFPVVATLLAIWAIEGTGVFPAADLQTNVLLILAGPLTAIPLAMFSLGARRIRLSTLGFLQYLSPSITLVLATLWWGEPFTMLHAVTFGLIWLALGLISAESFWRERRAQPVAPPAE